MAADMSLRVLTDSFTAMHYAITNAHCIGSLFFVSNSGIVDVKGKLAAALGYDNLLDLYTEQEKTPGIWVGEVSWLKAAWLADEDSYIPSVVGKISDIVGERFPIIDESLIGDISAAFDLPNTTSYSVNSRDAVVDWLREHTGKRVFTANA